MAYISFHPKDHFDTYIYTPGGGGGHTNSSLSFKPDKVWFKQRNGNEDPAIYDVCRGTTKRLLTNSTGAESTEASGLTAFNSDGWVTGADGKSGTASQNYVSWNWKGGGTGSSNSDGTITSTVSANPTAGFSVVSYTGNGSSSQTVGHGLSSAPELIIAKNRDASQGWLSNISVVDGTWDYVFLNTTATSSDSSFTLPTTSVFHLNSSSAYSNTNGEKVVAYCFHSVKGYSKIGVYNGNGSADGHFVYTGFKPAFVLCKGQSVADNWVLLDNKRDTHPNPRKLALFPNTTGGASAEAGDYLTDFLSNGFKFRSSTGSLNSSSHKYIYIAFAEEPLVSTNNIPATAE